MLIYANILELERHLIGSEVRINDQQNWKTLLYPLFYKNKAYKNVNAQNREFTQHNAPADDDPKKSRNEHGHAILSQALARIWISR